MPKTSPSKQQFAVELLECLATDIFQLPAFEQIPHAFLRVEFRCIAWQAFQVKAFGCTFRQKVLDGLGTMNACPIPNDEQVALDFAQELLQEADHVGALVGALLRLHEEPPIRGNCSNGRDVITSQRDRQDRRFSNWRVGSHSMSQQIKPRLVYENEGAFFVFGFFLSAGNVWSRQMAMAASSRWVARVMGFCWLYFIWRRRRLQWAG